MFIVHSEAIIHLVGQAQQLVRSEAGKEGKSDHIPPSLCLSLSASAHPSFPPSISFETAVKRFSLLLFSPVRPSLLSQQIIVIINAGGHEMKTD